MTLHPGTRLGPYEITAAIGAGGMGEVYRGRDATLNRDVAIKVLPAAMAADPERMARFKREAQVLASLNHPNIAAIFGMEVGAPLVGALGEERERAGTRPAPTEPIVALVMELVEGEDLSDRLKRSAVPVDEAIAIARQIADGLEEAHEHGIIHRDLKPANIKVTADGKVKILDFGLAKALEGDPSTSAVNSQLSHSPTMSRHMTEAGMIMGTAAYMSPEQARGKPVDKRSDIWSFGVVLFEMLSGQRLFTGETASDVLAGVLKTEIDFNTLPAATPSSLRRLLGQCLERNPRNRLHDIADARLALNEAESDAEAPRTVDAAVGTISPSLNRRLRWIVGGAAAAIAAVAFLLGQSSAGRGTGATEPLRLQWAPPEGGRLALSDQSGGGFAISPDGSQIVYTVWAGATSELRVQSLHSGISTVLPGTELGNSPFFSPDGKWVGFAAGPKVKKIALAGGAPITIADAPFFRGAVWSDDGSIYFAPNVYTPLERVSAAGGATEPVTSIRTAEGEVQHRWPTVIPDQKVLIYVAGLGGEWDDALIVAQRLDSEERKVLVRGGTSPRYLPTGYLVYAKAGGLYAVTLDPRSLEVTGAPVEVARNVFSSSLGSAAMDVSGTGLLVTAPVDSVAGASILSWADREGRGEALKLAPANYIRIALSPGGDRVALNVGNTLSVLDLTRLSTTRITLAGRAWSPVWAPDGRRLYFAYEQDTGAPVYSKAADDTGEAKRLFPNDPGEPVAASQDGSRLLTLEARLKGPRALVVRDLRSPESEPMVLLQSANMNGLFADFSPDGRFVVYQTEDSGRPEIYIRPANGDDRKWQVSIDGGTDPAWSDRGDEIFFRSGPKLVAAPVRFKNNEPVIEKPGVLFENRRVLAFDATRDGNRFLIAEDPKPGAQPKLDVVLNWFDEVKRKVAAARTP